MKTPRAAIIDTGTSLILGPKDAVDKINEPFDLFPDVPFIDCSKLSTLSPIAFTIGGREFVLEGKDYVIQFTLQGYDYCMSGVAPVDYPFWLVGDVFLRKFYTVFDFGDSNRGPRIGFANSI